MENLGSGTIFGRMAKTGSGTFFRLPAYSVFVLSLVVCSHTRGRCELITAFGSKLLFYGFRIFCNILDLSYFVHFDKISLFYY